MNRSIRMSLLAFTVLGCGGRPGPEVPAASPPVGTAAVEMERFAGSPGAFAGNSGYETPATLVISDSAGWVLAWSRIHAGQEPLPSLPAVDFTRRMVVLAAIGQQPNGGHTVHLTTATTSGDTLVIHAEHRIPGAACVTTQALVEPVDIATVARSAAAVRFDVQPMVFECSADPE